MRELLPAEQTVHSTDPLRAQIAVELDGDELTVTIDGELDVGVTTRRDAFEAGD